MWERIGLGGYDVAFSAMNRHRAEDLSFYVFWGRYSPVSTFPIFNFLGGLLHFSFSAFDDVSFHDGKYVYSIGHASWYLLFVQSVLGP